MGEKMETATVYWGLIFTAAMRFPDPSHVLWLVGAAKIISGGFGVRLGVQGLGLRTFASMSKYCYL